jgi:hypothetical protein
MREEKCVQDFGGETSGNRPLGRPKGGGKIILRIGMWGHGLDNLAQDRDL